MIRNLAATVALFIVAYSPASASCAVSEAALRRSSDIIVRGKGRFSAETISAIVANRVIKGRRLRTYPIVFERRESESENCAWQPLYEKMSGIFYLTDMGDHRFAVIAFRGKY